ncbi:N-acetyltransferase 9-like protein [Drosophila santomea]|uniref:N-acetyltransferase 9-like protein n=1 Tax=Drosophila santomea TaxID=129105 RepID=UPI001952F855|nr:N-acetyltransferase 9-like protein [Drosophila santomea]XP_039496025.1 N-acetyltransferase 9-like protein [Drosophila santomea]
MHLNENTKILGRRVILVPYEARHVPKYHQWMSNETLRELTASEELTLEEEHEMQRSWREDDDKLTFIVLDAETYARDQDEITAMVGDTNLFLHQDPDSQQQTAEAEIMIAEPDARGKGFGREAMLLMLKYAQAQSQLKLDKFEVKIDMDNAASLHLFKSFTFVETRRVEVFHEVTLERPITADWIKWLDQQVDLRTQSYQ